MLQRSLAALLLVASAALAQNEESKVYQLDFQIRHLENGKVTSTRNHSALAVTGVGHTGCQIRSGNRVPNGNTNNYLEVGVNIDCKAAKEIGEKFSIQITAEISEVAPVDGSSSQLPIIRQIRWNSTVLVPNRKATILFSSDDSGTKVTTQLEMTATPIK